MRKTLLSLSLCLMPLLSACPAQLPVLVPQMPQVGDVSGSYHLNAFEQALLSPDGNQVFYSLSQEDVVRFKTGDTQAYSSHLSLGLYDRGSGSRRPMTQAGLEIMPDRFSIGWAGPESLVLLKRGSHDSLVRVNPTSGARQVLYTSKEYLGQVHPQGDWLYFSDRPADGIQRLSLSSGVLETAYKVPLDFYQSFDFHFDAAGHLFLNMYKSHSRQGQQPADFRIACGFGTMAESGASAGSKGDFSVSCAIPPSSDSYLVRPDKSLLHLKPLDDSYGYQSEGTLTLGPDQRHLSYIENGRLQVISLDADQDTLFTRQATHAFWLDAGRMLLLQDSEARVYDIASGQQLRQLSLPFDPSQAHWDALRQEVLIAGDQQTGVISAAGPQLAYSELGRTAAGEYRIFGQDAARPLLALHQVPDQPARLYHWQQGQLKELLSQQPETTPIVYSPKSDAWMLRYVRPE